MSQQTAAGLRYAYYPGCSLEAMAREYDLSVRAVCDHLGIELAEIPDWNCCGASSGHSTNRRLASTLAGRNLALAEEMEMDIAVACPACYIRLRSAQNELIQDNEQRNELTGVTDFHRIFLGNIERWGRQHELSLILMLKLKTKDLFSDLNMGIKMLLKGKLKLFPVRFSEIKKVRDLFRRTER